MQSRKTILELFSTFLSLSGDRPPRWLIDARLQRHMQHCLSIQETTANEFWVVHWHRQWRQEQEDARQPLRQTLRQRLPQPVRRSHAEGHLSAYLQETCYWSVHRVMPKSGSGQFQLSDCFQVAIAAVPKLLQKFDSTQRPSLNAYANRAFGNVVRDYLRQRQEVDLCSDWSLLLKVSRKRLLEALQNGGVDQPSCDRILLAWTCFEEVYLPTKSPGLRQLPAPDAATWTAVSEYYDRQRRSNPSLPAASPEKLERELLQAAKHVRNLIYPSIQSLNRSKDGDGGEMSGELQDDLPASEQDSLLSGLISAEEIRDRQNQQRQVQTFLDKTIEALTPQQQDLLTLYYRDRLKQQQIATQLGIQQYTVSRQLTKTREALLLKLMQWAQETWHILPDSNVVNAVSTILEDWLQQSYTAVPNTAVPNAAVPTEETPA